MANASSNMQHATFLHNETRGIEGGGPRVDGITHTNIIYLDIPH